MARSLARTSSRTVARPADRRVSAVRRQCLELPVELLDAVLERALASVPVPDDGDHDACDGERDKDEEETRHGPAPTSDGARSSSAPVPQASPSAQRSFFQMGTVAFVASIARRAAA